MTSALTAFTHTNGTVELRRAATAQERHVLQTRARELTELLHPWQDRDRKALIDAVAAMMAGFPTYGMTAEDAYEAAAGYVMVSRGFPAWAIRQVCDDIRAGRAPRDSHKNRPTEPEFRSLVERAGKVSRETLAKILSILDGSPPGSSWQSKSSISDRNCATSSALCARFGLRPNSIPAGIGAVELTRLAHTYGVGASLQEYLDGMTKQPPQKDGAWITPSAAFGDH